MSPPSSPRPSRPSDPRPLVGEPLGLDLLNTHWIEGGTVRDLLADVPGLATFLRSIRLDDDRRGGPDGGLRTASADVLQALHRARDVIQAVAEHPDDDARTAFNDLLARGHRERFLDARGPATRVVVAEPSWAVGWLAADNYLDLITARPERIRRCEHERCILWFLDTSRSGTRRWCSMAGCGNRVKASRYHRRHADRTGIPVDGSAPQSVPEG
jgi:predicted RNA-binding Zn ribbon-like protein